MISEKIKNGINSCFAWDVRCDLCPYDKDESGQTISLPQCKKRLAEDILQAFEDYENVISLLEAE